MMNGGNLYGLAKLLGHSSIKMTQRYAELERTTSPNTAKEMWRLLEGEAGRNAETGPQMFPYCSPR